MFHDIFISQIVGKFPGNFSEKVPLFFRKNFTGNFRKFPNLQPYLGQISWADENAVVCLLCSSDWGA